MSRLVIIALTIISAFAINSLAANPPGDNNPTRVRIGTYDARAVAVAFVASPTTPKSRS